MLSISLVIVVVVMPTDRISLFLCFRAQQSSNLLADAMRRCRCTRSCLYIHTHT
jgi:hypothetical protein